MGDFKDGVAWVVGRGNLVRAEKNKIRRAFSDYIGSGKSEEEALDLCLTRFSGSYLDAAKRPLTERVLRNTVCVPTGGVADSLTQATLIVNLQKLTDSCQEQIAEIDEELDKTEELTGMLVVEEECTDGGKFAGNKKKKIPVLEHRLRLMDRKIKAGMVFFDSVKALLPRDRVNIFVKDGDVSILADQDIDAQLRKFDESRREVK